MFHRIVKVFRRIPRVFFVLSCPEGILLYTVHCIVYSVPLSFFFLFVGCFAFCRIGRVFRRMPMAFRRILMGFCVLSFP